MRPGGRELIDELRGDSGVEVPRGAQPELPVVAWSGVHTCSAHPPQRVGKGGAGGEGHGLWGWLSEPFTCGLRW